MTSIESLLVGLALVGAPGELPPSPSAPPAAAPAFGASAPIEPSPSRRATAFIKGRVVSRSGPVAYAHVWVPAHHIGDMANEEGAFTLRVPTGACTLQVLGPGHYRRSVPIQVAKPGLDSLVVAIDPMSTPVVSCNPWFEVDPKQGDSWNVRPGPCGSSGGASAFKSRNWGRLSIAEFAGACELTVQWGWSGKDTARVTVRDSRGAVMRTLVESDPARSASLGRGGTVTWDGTRDDGSVATAGEYRVRIEARGKHLELAALLRRYGP